MPVMADRDEWRGKGLGEAVRDRIAEGWADLKPGSSGITLAEAVEAAR
ncbi:hypothetical protein GCM10009809_35910 [Isoptericola hypogeus]|uniref:GNAT family N-acetyltransferase n=1 Tax=Isoptericola hypogeus TaxID=300179 RepID=A0ABP4VTN9_9MICO